MKYRVKRYTDGKERHKTGILFTNDITAYVEKSKGIYGKKKKLFNEFKSQDTRLIIYIDIPM